MTVTTLPRDRIATTPPANGYVALYCRISRDRGGRVEGVKAQERWGRAYAARTWPGVPVRLFADNDLSAAAEGVTRPGYEDLRAAVGRGEVAHLWTVEQSRLERREVGWFTLAAELDAAGITAVHTNRDGIVSVRSEVAGIKAVINAAEARRMKERINDTLRTKAEQGQPAGTRPYGYRHGRLPNGEKTYVVVEDQAAHIREAAERVLDGWSLTAIAADLAARGVHGSHRVKVRDERGEVVTADGRLESDGGVPVTRPGKLTPSGIKQWMINAAVAGQRVYRGEILGPGNWEPILDEATWRAVRNRLSAPRTVARRDGGAYQVAAQRHTGRRYLLTGGTAVCGVCGAPLIAQMQNRPDRGVRAGYYQCTPRRGGRGCVTITADPFEAYVVDRLLSELDKPEFTEALADDGHAARRDEITTTLAAIDAQRGELAKEWSARDITMAEWRDARDGLAAQERALRAELASVPPPVTRVDPAAIRAGWEAMNLDERREVISLFIGRVAVGKVAYRGKSTFDPERIAPVDTWWRRTQ